MRQGGEEKRNWPLELIHSRDKRPEEVKMEKIIRAIGMALVRKAESLPAYDRKRMKYIHYFRWLSRRYWWIFNKKGERVFREEIETLKKNSP